MIVVDASVLVPALGDDGEDGRGARARLRGERLAAPEVVDLEVASAVRRHVRSGRVDPGRGLRALGDLARMPLARAPHRPLLERIWALGDALTAYDAAYVALAEALGAALVTADGGLARAPGIRCEVRLLP